MADALDVVIVSFNNRADLEVCLASLAAALPARPQTVVVVDNASADGSAAAVRARFPAVTVIGLDANTGFAAANNAGLRATRAPLVLFLNSDTIVPAGAIDALIDRLEATGAAAAGPRLLDAGGHPEVSFGPMLSPLGEMAQAIRVWLAARSFGLARRYIRRHVAREREVDWVSGACLLARRAALEAVGGFDIRYFLYEEDVDLCAALRARGGRVLFTPRAELTHLRGRSLASPATGAADRHALYDRSHLAFYAKHRPAFAPALRLWKRLRGRSIR